MRGCIRKLGEGDLPQFLLLPPGQHTRHGKHAVVDNDLGARLKRGYQIFEYFDAILIGPVVEDPSEVVYVRLAYRLLSEKVVGHELYPVCKVGGDGFLRGCDHSVKVLHYE